MVWIFKTGDYPTASDEALAAAVREHGDQRAFDELLGRFRPFILGKIAGLRDLGQEPDDLAQICSIALHESAKYYDASKGASFRTFAGVCINHRLCSAVRRAKSQKNLLLDESVELTEDIRADESCFDPEYILSEREAEKQQEKFIRDILSDREYNVFMRYLSGMTYEEISKELDISVKSVDNSLSRARGKLRNAKTKK